MCMNTCALLPHAAVIKCLVTVVNVLRMLLCWGVVAEVCAMCDASRALWCGQGETLSPPRAVTTIVLSVGCKAVTLLCCAFTEPA